MMLLWLFLPLITLYKIGLPINSVLIVLLISSSSKFALPPDSEGVLAWMLELVELVDFVAF